MFKIKLFLVLFQVQILFAFQNLNTKWVCNEKNEQEVDNLVALLITIGRADVQFPVTEEEMKDYCK